MAITTYERIHQATAVAAGATWHDYGVLIDKAGASSALYATLADVQHGVFNAKAYGAVGDGVTDDTAAIQGIIDDVAAAGGGTIWFPDGKYLISQITMPGVANGGATGIGDGCQVIMRGNGIKSILYSETVGPMIVWEGGMSSRSAFYNLYIWNNVVEGYCMEYTSSDLDSYRLWLTIRDCTFESFGVTYPTGDRLTFATLNFTGLLGSIIDGCYFMGNSRIGGGALGGWNIWITDSSNTVVRNIYMGCGTRACANIGMRVTRGGNFLFENIRLDTGSRGGDDADEQPSFWFDDTKLSTIIALRGEGKDSDPWLKISDSHNLVFIDIDTGGMTVDDANVVQIENSDNITFYGGKIERNDEVGWTGKCIYIDADCYRVHFYNTNIVYSGSAAALVTNLGTYCLLELLDGNSASYFNNPPTASRLLGTRLTSALRIGENAAQIDNVHYGYKGWDVGSLDDGEIATTTVTMSNTIQSETVIGVSLTSITSGNWLLYGYMSNDTTATVYLENRTGGTVDLAEGTLQVITMRMTT